MLTTSLSPRFFWYYSILIVIFLLLTTSCCLSIQTCYNSSFIIIDSFCYWLMYITILVLFFSPFATLTFSNSFYSSFLLLGLSSYLVFATSNLLTLYMFYEFSLVPIIYIIINWGSYPERMSSSLIMLLYTAVFSFPLIASLLYFYYSGSLFIIPGFTTWCVPFWVCGVVFLAFSVNLPLYGIHHWLPMAHVEAPTSGSMVLAGVLLNLGGCGMFRFSQVVPLYQLRDSIISYLVVSLVIASLVCLSQSDFKRIVAYSSVVHMTAVVLGIISITSLGSSASLSLMVLHGLSSPLMFLLVGVVYEIYGTRLLPILRGLLSLSPLLSLFAISIFMANTPTPPFSSFIAEVVLFWGISYLSIFVVFGVLAHAFLSILFNSQWLTSVVFGTSPLSHKSIYLSFSEFSTFFVFSVSLLVLTIFIGLL